MARLIVQILDGAAESDAAFRPLRERIHQDEAKFLAAVEGLNATLMCEIIGTHCRAMFAIRHDGWPTAECDELIVAMKRASEALDFMAMVDTFERLLRLCQSESRTSIRQAIIRDIERAREQAATAVKGARWKEAGPAFADMLCSLVRVRPDFEELPSLIAEAKASGVFERRPDHEAALAEKVHGIMRSLVNRYADDLDRSLFDGMMSALMRGRTEIPPDEWLPFLSDVVARAVVFRKGSQRPALPVKRTQPGRN